MADRQREMAEDWGPAPDETLQKSLNQGKIIEAGHKNLQGSSYSLTTTFSRSGASLLRFTEADERAAALSARRGGLQARG